MALGKFMCCMLLCLFSFVSSAIKAEGSSVINIENNFSYKQFVQLNIGAEGLVINSSLGFDDSLESDDSVKVILVAVTGKERSLLEGEVRLDGKRRAGEKIKLILVNPNGINCDGCSFVDIDEVELRTDRVNLAAENKIGFYRNLSGDIEIGENGVMVQNGGLKLISGKVNIKGKMFAKGELKIAAYYVVDKLAELGGEVDDQKEKYVLNVSPHAAITSENRVYIKALGDINFSGPIYSKGSIKIKGKSIFIDKMRNVESYGGDRVVGLRAQQELEVEGDKVYLFNKVKLKSGNFLKITGEVIGSGSLESQDIVSVASSGKISLVSIDSQKDISLLAKGDIAVSEIGIQQQGDAKFYGREVSINDIKGVEKLMVCSEELAGDFKLHDVKKFELMGKESLDNAVDFVVSSPMEFAGDFKFIGRSFRNQSVFKARSVTLNLTEDFVNEKGGEIIVEKGWNSVSRGFTNYHNISAGDVFQVQGGTFINDEGGKVEAGSISAYLTGRLEGKRYRGSGFYQSSDSTLESKNGGIKIIAANGGGLLWV